VSLLRSLGLSVTLEPMNLFSDFEPDDNRRPDILIRNPYGGGKQIILDVSVTGINGTTRTNDETNLTNLWTPDPIRKSTSMVKQLTKITFVLFQSLCPTPAKCTRFKLQLVDDEVKKSKVQAIMKNCVRSISAAINRSASRNILLKATKMVNLERYNQQNSTSSTSCDSTYSSNSFPSEELRIYSKNSNSKS